MKQTYFRVIIFLSFVFTGYSVSAQGFGLPTGFDVKAFAKNEDLSMWFLQYDTAYYTVANFDHLTGAKDYICIPDKKNWKVVVGTPDAEKGFKDDAVYYMVDAKRAVTVVKKKFDTLIVQNMGRALYNATTTATKANLKAPAGWKKFTRVNEDKSITVWMFCDADNSSTIYYGPEAAYYYSADGRSMSTSKVANKAPVMAGKTSSTLSMACPAEKMPSIGAMYTARRFMLIYNEVSISYKTGTSTLRYNVAEHSYAWEHVAN